jgi:hypothetical protein
MVSRRKKTLCETNYEAFGLVMENVLQQWQYARRNST